jgi:uncharacterized protein involved in exopolysaccharide biosynthesis
MNDSATAGAPQDVKLKSLGEIVSRDRKLIAIVTLIVTIITAIGAIISQKQYKGTVQFSVVTQDQKGGAGGLMSSFGALASLAGVSVGGESDKYEPIALLESRFLTEMYIQQNNLLPILFPKAWDAQAGRWKDPATAPTLWKGDAQFKKIRAVVTDAKTGLVTVSITWPDPEVAAKWANGLVALTNKQMRERALHESDRHITYLREQAERTELVPVQQALSTLMENEYKESMLAGGTEEYSLKVIDPAFVPETPSSLRRSLVTLIGLLGGLFISIVFVFIRASWRGER